MTSENVLEIKIFITENGWVWSVILNGLHVSSRGLGEIWDNKGRYTTPRGAKDAFGRWLWNVDNITSAIYRPSSANLSKMRVRFKVEGE